MMKRTKKNTAEVAKQVGRLTSIELLNDAQDSELTDVIFDLWPSVEKLRADVTEIVREWEKVPTPKQLTDFAKARYAKKLPASRCTTCYGSGKVYRWHLITFDKLGNKVKAEMLTDGGYGALKGKNLRAASQGLYELPIACQCVGSEENEQQAGYEFDPEYETLTFREQLVRDGCHSLVEILDSGVSNPLLDRLKSASERAKGAAA